MKTKFFLTVIFTVFAVTTFAQNWNSSVSIFSVNSDTKVSNYIDYNGIHIAYYRNGGIKYALINSSGSVIRSNVTVESENSNCDFANISAVNGNVYIVYKKESKIRIAKSTNLGANWNTNFSERDLINTGCNWINAEVNADDIHVVWSEIRTGGGAYDVHYNRVNTNDSVWNNYKCVTDADQNGGQYPTVAFSENKVHVGYQGINSSANWPKTRDRIVSSNTWEDPQLVPIKLLGFTNISNREKVFVENNYLHVIYRSQHSSYQGDSKILGHSYRSLSSSSWSEDATYYNLSYSNDRTAWVQTTNKSIHVMYIDNNSNFTHRKLTGGTTWSSTLNLPSLFSSSQALGSNGNDLYYVQLNDYNYLVYQQYDANPLVPQNLAVTAVAGKPKLTWTPITEPDVRINNNGVRIEQRLDVEGNGQWTSWSEIATASGTDSFYTDNSITTAGSGPSYAQYRIRARDIEGYNSDYSSPVQIRYGEGIEKRGSNGSDIPNEFHLSQNYPNPFNPSTKIKFGIPYSSFASLKVYDVLGQIVAALFNNTLDAGNYEIELNSIQSELKSGIYYYELRSNDFHEVKKFMLLK